MYKLSFVKNSIFYLCTVIQHKGGTRTLGLEERSTGSIVLTLVLLVLLIFERKEQGKM